MTKSTIKFETETYTLPTHWAVALINDDTGGLDDDDQAALDAFVSDMVARHGQCHCVDVTGDDDGNFMTHHDARVYGVLACDVSTYTFDVTKR